MTEPTVEQRRRELTWRIAGLWMVLLAVGLAVIGIVLAIQQARSFTLRVMTHAHTEAGHFVENAQNKFVESLTNALRVVADTVNAGEDNDWQRPDSLPGWMTGVAVSRDGRVWTLGGGSEELRTVVERRLAILDLDALTHSYKPRIILGRLTGEPIDLALMAFGNNQSGLMIVATEIDRDRLKAELLDPLVSTHEGLEVVATGSRRKPWSQPFASVMHTWSVEPTDAFIREQRSTVQSQTLIYSVLTLLALTVLLISMWLVIRVMRSDMALAQMKSNFVADVSHELKTPLALIRMFGETLMSGRVTSEEKRQEYYEIITRESARLTSLIDNILDFSQIEALRKNYLMVPTDISDVVRDTYEAYRPQLEHCGFEHHLSIAGTLPVVNADCSAITRAMINLINNAIKYSHDERYLEIDVSTDTRRGKRGVLISVHDRGIGIRPEDRARLFEGFFRASDTRVREQGGTGLGLRLVKHIVDGHQGSIDVESRLVKGSTFRIFLPAADGASVSEGTTGSRDAHNELATEH